jgi:uncharacterized DUF497 family protein
MWVRMETDGFDWDEGNITKCEHHGLSMETVESVFYGNPMLRVNVRHTSQEKRMFAIGLTLEGRYAYVVFTLRQRDGLRLLRPISARYMHKKEIANYEKERKR